MKARIDGVWALVPVKRFGRAKSRLAPVLDRTERAALAKAMLADVLEAVTCASGFSGALLVTEDGEAVAIGAGFGAVAIGDPSEAGVNAAVAHGLGRLARSGARSAVIIPADVPFLALSELARVTDALRDASVVIAPAARDGGTNLLAMSPPDLMPTAYGTGSFERHVAIARERGVEPAILRLEGAGRDIDVAADLEVAPGGGGRRTRDVLRRRAEATHRPELRMISEGVLAP